MSELTKDQWDILDHTANRASRPGQYCGKPEGMQGLVDLGLMQYLGKASWCPDEFFGITAAGRKALSGRKTEKMK
jgi:hypothetical protein